jgi:hypothetical protein
VRGIAEALVRTIHQGQCHTQIGLLFIGMTSPEASQ